MNLFIDGELITTTDLTGFTVYANTDDGFSIGSQKSSASNEMNGIISNARIIKGTALYTSRFTVPTEPLTNVTNTVLLCCQSNTSATEGAVKPGTITANGDAVATNFNPFNTNINTVRGQETGQVTLNPLSTSEATLSNGNLDYSSSSNMHTVTSTISVSSGKWYWENERVSGGSHYYVGIADVDTNVYGNWTGSNSGYSWSVNTAGSICHNNAEGGDLGSVASISATGTVVGWALDMDEGTLVIYKNGNPVIPSSISSPNPKNANSIVSTTDLAGRRISPAHGHSSHRNMRYNFGQNPFKFPPPDGYQPLNAANVRPETVIARPNQYVGIITYNGNGGTQNVSFGSTISFDGNPDLVWIKHRDRSQAHVWYDSVRTAGVGKAFNSNDDGEEGAAGDGTTYGYLSEFTRNGFTVIDGSDAEDYVNKSGAPYVAWCWKAGGAPTATNTQSSGAMTANSVSVDGVLQSAYTPSGSPTIYPKKMSVGTKQGFSIVQYVGNDTAGATLPHGLLQAPDFFVTKADYDSREWQVYHQGLGNQQPIRLNTDQAAQSANAAYFNNTSPTASVVTFGTGGDANQGGETPLTYIMYAWHDVPGLQKFGTFTGNADSGGNGPFVELGFRPAVIWFKATTGTQPWNVYDSERGKINPIDEGLLINTPGTEFTGTARVDYLSNGFKVRAPSGGNPNVATTYIYCAWAEAPSVDLFGGGANAR
jgi:hypothetical protein